MNKKIIENILGNNIKSSLLNGDFSLTNATTNIQHSGINDLVFYFVHENEKAESLFLERVKESNSGLIVLNREILDLKKNYVVVSDFLEGQKQVCDYLYPNKGILKFAGVTGTNGKTTTVNLAVQIAQLNGVAALSIGTLGVFDAHKEIYPEISATTPSYLELRKIIHKFQDSFELVFMEVSSHALMQDRLYDIKLDAGAWTSFSQDHLDYHGTLEEYFLAKCKITEKLKNKKNLFVPEHEEEICLRLKGKDIPFEIVSDFYIEEDDIPYAFRTKYNYNNLLLATKLFETLTGIKNKNLYGLKLPRGRFSVYECGDHLFVIDYAHSPDAVKNICHAIASAFPNMYLITVFGCGGDRDKLKRPLMGEAAAKYSNLVVVTSDNPRSESPMDIINDIIPGLEKANYIVEENREEAIVKAFNSKKGPSIILIAGKGHEEYQEVNGRKLPFSDFSVVEKIISEQ